MCHCEGRVKSAAPWRVAGRQRGHHGLLGRMSARSDVSGDEGTVIQELFWARVHADISNYHHTETTMATPDDPTKEVVSAQPACVRNSEFMPSRYRFTPHAYI